MTRAASRSHGRARVRNLAPPARSRGRTRPDAPQAARSPAMGTEERRPQVHLKPRAAQNVGQALRRRSVSVTRRTRAAPATPATSTRTSARHRSQARTRADRIAGQGEQPHPDGDLAGASDPCEPSGLACSLPKSAAVSCENPGQPTWSRRLAKKLSRTSASARPWARASLVPTRHRRIADSGGRPKPRSIAIDRPARRSASRTRAGTASFSPLPAL